MAGGAPEAPVLGENCSVGVSPMGVGELVSLQELLADVACLRVLLPVAFGAQARVGREAPVVSHCDPAVRARFTRVAACVVGTL